MKPVQRMGGRGPGVAVQDRLTSRVSAFDRLGGAERQAVVSAHQEFQISNQRCIKGAQVL